MTADKRTSRYHVQGGPTEVVRLDIPRSAVPPRIRSEKRPIAHPTLEAGDQDLSRAQTPEPTRTTRPRTAAADPRTHDEHAMRLLEEILGCDPKAVEPLMPRVERFFDHLAPHYMRRFPGPLWVDLRVPQTEPPRGAMVSGMSACLVAMGERSVPVVLGLLRSSRSDQRFCAALVARELPFEPVPAALVDLALHDDPSSRLAAALVLPEISHARGHAAAVDTLRRIVRDARETTLRVRAAQALEELRDAGAVPALVSLLGSGDPELVEVARSALRTITAHSYSRLGWWFWLRSHGNEPRFAWLRAAMENGDPEHGAIAQRELIRLLGRVALDGSEEPVAPSTVERRRNRRSWP